MSTPFASGIAALLYAISGPRSAGTEPAVEGFLLAGAQPLGATDPTYGMLLGAGRVSAAGSVSAAVIARSGAQGSSDPVVRRLTP